MDMIEDYYSKEDGGWQVVNVKTNPNRQSHGAAPDPEGEVLRPLLIGQSNVLQQFHVEQLSRHLPPRTVGYPWQLKYGTATHGTSLRTLYRTLAPLSSPVLLAVQDTHKQVFGALASEPFKVSEHFYGTGECFLFTFNPDLKVFRWTGDNTFFIKGDLDSLGMGSGRGAFGLWLDSDLYHGRSHHCDTFGNAPLSTQEDFSVNQLEVWAFL
ncbi:oxidation resistance protein 1-like [Lethenteron reissneri]|uniref:oxidation resistance protein 1-like n=2 Tax=Lethenteron reissneri TaxID=7753 RepID=UPI002AB65943|nr:oxidation resistance protein 1-like [Lethenteron reissneri]